MSSSQNHDILDLLNSNVPGVYIGLMQGKALQTLPMLLCLEFRVDWNPDLACASLKLSADLNQEVVHGCSN